MKLNLQENFLYTVNRISKRKLTKRLHFNETEQFIDVPRWAGINEGSVIERREGVVSIICKSGKAQLLPTYEACESYSGRALSRHY